MCKSVCWIGRVQVGVLDRTCANQCVVIGRVQVGVL